MKRFIFTVLILTFLNVLILSVSIVTASPNLFKQAEEAQIRGDWEEADRLLAQLLDKVNSTRKKFAIFATRAWIAVQAGKLTEARVHLERAERAKFFNGKLSDVDRATLTDIEAVLLLSNQIGLPPKSQRIVLGTGKDSGTGKGFDEINQRVEQGIKAYMRVSSVKKPFAIPLPPKLDKDEFETTSIFLERVAAAKKNYEERVQVIQKDFNKRLGMAKLKLERKKLNLPEIRKILTQQAMNEVFGAPILLNVRYDADIEEFIGEVIAGGEIDNPFIYFQIALHVPGVDNARAFKPSLMKARPLLIYRMEGESLSLTKILLSMPDTTLKIAKLADKKTETAQMSYKVPKIAVEDVIQADVSPFMASMGSVASLSIDPEIAKLKNEIYEIKRKKMVEDARSQELNRLKAELALYESVEETNFDDDLPDMLKKVEAVPYDETKYAIIIGIDHYEATENVQFAKRSANLFSKVAEKLLGVPKDHIHLLTNDKATGMRIKVSAKEFVRRLDNNSTLYFYYARPWHTCSGEEWITVFTPIRRGAGKYSI